MNLSSFLDIIMYFVSILLANDESGAVTDSVPAQAASWASFVPLVLIFIVFYFFVIRPQQKKMKAHNDMLSSVKSGDHIITTGGIIAKVLKISKGDNDVLEIEVSKDVKMKIKRSYIAEVITDIAGVVKKEDA